jgi:hypothetical protein
MGSSSPMGRHLMNLSFKQSDKTLIYNTDMTTTVNSLSAEAIKNKILNSKGQFVKVRYRSNPKPKAEFKNILLEKVTSTVIQAGVNYANLSSIKQGIADGTRGEVQELPFGSWMIDKDTGKSLFPYLITHTPKDSDTEVIYLRMTTSQCDSHRPKSIYYANNEIVDKATFATYLTNSDAKKLMEPSEAPPVYNIKLENLLDIPEDID